MVASVAEEAVSAVVVALVVEEAVLAAVVDSEATVVQTGRRVVDLVVDLVQVFVFC